MKDELIRGLRFFVVVMVCFMALDMAVLTWMELVSRDGVVVEAVKEEVAKPVTDDTQRSREIMESLNKGEIPEGFRLAYATTIDIPAHSAVCPFNIRTDSEMITNEMKRRAETDKIKRKADTETKEMQDQIRLFAKRGFICEVLGHSYEQTSKFEACGSVCGVKVRCRICGKGGEE